ncbi:MAG: histone deacetylase [Methanobacterium sp.]|uniref:histone deacetylase family protein n=1 Tax=Methanobacterium sp. TaxID=2164 RepID=UPI003D64DFB3|nr:histone deacetylase [Methanobacterium sp.]
MTALIYSDEYKKHDTGNHPENQGRLNAIMSSLKNEGILDKIDIISPKPATTADLLRVHSKSHVEEVKSLCESGGGYIDYDTFAAPESYEIAKLAAGGAIQTADFALKNNEIAYSVARPPGHHATSDKSMGFCIFNNLAIALEYLKAVHKIKKFLIFDFDVHYGNGTAEIFYNDPDVLYISIHQDPRTIFPGSGFIEETGSGKGEGYNLNIPMAPSSTTDDYIYILDQILEPVASKFNADFYFVDVGFDGHVDDPLSSMALTDDFYGYIANKMKNIAGNMALILEGGYDLNALSRCNVKMINTLNNIMTEDYYKQELNVSENTQNTFNKITDVFSPFFEF